MADVDQIVQRTVDSIVLIARKATKFAGLVLVVAVVVCVGGFLLGVAALSGGVQSVWIVLATAFGAIAIGSAFVATWRVGSVRRNVPALTREIRALASEGTDAGRTVVDTFVVGDVAAGSAIELSRRMNTFRGTVGHGWASTQHLAAATVALASFPWLILSAIAISLVFAGLGFIFLIALAL